MLNMNHARITITCFISHFNHKRDLKKLHTRHVSEENMIDTIDSRSEVDELGNGHRYG